MSRSALLVHNPGSGQRRDRFHSVTRMVDALRLRGITVTRQVTSGPADATRLAAAAVAARADLVIVHGGDGTVNETMQAMVGTTTPLAVWPGGTSNVLARELGLPGSLDVLADVIAAGRMRRVSVGRAGERYFLLDWHPVRFLVETEGGQHSATFAVVANAPSYGGGLRFAPEASMDDDVLDLCLFDSTQRHQFARYLAAAFSGSHLGMPGVTYLKTRRAVVHGDGSRFVQVDGELYGPLPVSFECVPAALSLVVP